MGISNESGWSLRAKLIAAAGVVCLMVALAGVIGQHYLAKAVSLAEDTQSTLTRVLADRKGEPAARLRLAEYDAQLDSHRRAQWVVGSLAGGAFLLAALLGIYFVR